MIPAFETLTVAVGGPSGEALTPGLVLRALAQGASLPADAVGTMQPVSRGAVAVEIAQDRARRIRTPLPLIGEVAGRPQVLVVSRPDDPPEPARFEIIIQAADGGPIPRPGAIAAALATSGLTGAEDVGAGLVGPSWLRVGVPAAVALSGRLEGTVDIGGRTFTIRSLDQP